MTEADGPSRTQHLLPAGKLDDVVLPSHLVAYQEAVAATSAADAAAPPAPVVHAAAPVATPVHATPTTTAPRVVTSPAVAPVVHIVGNSEVGQATWYSEAPAGKCASPTLPFGTVVTVRNNATGATTSCVVDDREAAGYPRVLDMSYSGFSQLADPNQGVVDVTISW